MTDPKHNLGVGLAGSIALLLVAGVVGIFMTSGEQRNKNREDDLAQIRPMQTQIDSQVVAVQAIADEMRRLRESMNDLQRSQAQQLDRAALDDAFASQRSAITSLEGQLNRRISLEVKTPIRRELDNIRRALNALDDDSEANENKIEDILQRIASVETMVTIQINNLKQSQ